jgi:hypothetical protein
MNAINVDNPAATNHETCILPMKSSACNVPERPLKRAHSVGNKRFSNSASCWSDGDQIPWTGPGLLVPHVTARSRACVPTKRVDDSGIKPAARNAKPPQTAPNSPPRKNDRAPSMVLGPKISLHCTLSRARYFTASTPPTLFLARVHRRSFGRPIRKEQHIPLP